MSMLSQASLRVLLHQLPLELENKLYMLIIEISMGVIGLPFHLTTCKIYWVQSL
jgi:hypothetical protein